MDKETNVFINAELVICLEGGEKITRKVGKIFKDSDRLAEVLNYFQLEMQNEGKNIFALYSDKKLSMELKDMTIHCYACEK